MLQRLGRFIAVLVVVGVGHSAQAQIPNYTVNTIWEGGTDANLRGQIALAPDGTIYFVDQDATKIQKIAVDGTVSTFAGGGTAHNLIIAHILVPPDTFPATDAALGTATNVSVDPDGNVYISLGSSIWKITPEGTMSRWQDIPQSPGGIPDIGFDADGNGYIRAGLVDGTSIIKRTVTGDTMTVAGGNGRDNTGDGGPATDAALDGLGGMAVSPGGEIWFYSADATIRKVSTDGTISLVAGTPGMEDPIGVKGIFTDQDALSLILDDSGSNMAVDAGGNLFFTPGSNTGDNINLLTFDGRVHTLAGIGDEGFAGDGGPSTDSEFSNITGMAVSADGVIYVADWGNNRIRTLTPDGPLAGGDGSSGGSGGGSGGDDGTTGGGDGTTGGDDGTTGGDDATTVILPEGEVGPVGLGLDPTFGDQGVRQTETNPDPGDLITVDVFVTAGADDVAGFEVSLAWDPMELTYVSFAPTDIFAGAAPIPTLTDSTATLSSALLGFGLSASADEGTAGQATFQVADTFTGPATVTLTDAKLGADAVDIGPGAEFVVIGGVAEVELTPAQAANFDGDPAVGFGDFLIFAGGFGKSSSDGDFDARLDLDGDGTVGFLDFLKFAEVFGQTI